MDYTSVLMADDEREEASRIRIVEIENKISRLKCEQNNCIDNMNYLNYLKEKLKDSQWELSVILNQSFRHEYLGEVVIPNIFEGIGANKIKKRFEETREKMYEYTEDISEIIYGTEQQIARLHRHISSLDAEIQSLRVMI